MSRSALRSANSERRRLLIALTPVELVFSFFGAVWCKRSLAQVDLVPCGDVNPDRPMLVKTLLALTVASIGIVIAAGGGAVGLGIGVFFFINALFALGALVWA